MRVIAAGLLAGMMLVVLGVAVGQDKEAPRPKDHKAIEILQKLDAATKAVQAVHYQIKVEGLGDLKDRLGYVEAEVILEGATQGGTRYMPKKYFVDARYRLPGASELQHVAGGSDGEHYFVIDYASKKVHADIDPAVLGTSARVLFAPWMIEFVVPEPFADELKGKSQALRPDETVGGAECYVVHVVYDVPQAPEATWYVSKKDFLPRARMDHFSLPDGTSGAMRKTLTKLDVDPKLPADAFAVRVPDGFTKTDDFAP